MSAAGRGAAAALLVVVLAVLARAAWRSMPRLAVGARVRGVRAAGPDRRRWVVGAPSLVMGRVGAAAPGVDADAVWSGWLGAGGFLVMAGAVVGGPGLGLVAVVCALGAPLVCEPGLRRHAVRRAAADVPVALESMARSVRAGASLHTALADASASAGPVVGEAFAGVLAATARGQPLADALELTRAGDGGVPGLALALTALAMAAESGGPHAAALDGVAATLRQRLAVQEEAASLGSQARMSALVIAAAPVAFLGLAFAADPANADFLLRTPLGIAMLLAGLVLDGAGAVWMSRLTRVELR